MLLRWVYSLTQLISAIALWKTLVIAKQVGRPARCLRYLCLCLPSVALCLLLLSVIPAQGRAAGNALYIYLPTDLKAHHVQRELDSACPNLNTLVFGSSREFWRQYKKSPPAAVITNGIIFDHLAGFLVGAEGLYKGKNSQHLYMVSAKAPPPEELTTQTIGMLNLLGRRKNQKFLQNVLKQPVRVRGVPKPRDLLPMLSFGVADLLVVSQHTLTYLQKASEQELFVKKLDLNFRINLAAFQESTDTAVRNNVAGCLEQINTLSFSSQLFSVDTWQTL